MVNTLEQAQDRFQNISSVEPLLEALRTISLGSWQQAINQRGYLQNYHEELLTLFATLKPLLETQYKSGVDNQKNILLSTIEENESQKKNLLIIIGSERGLCGNFNGIIVEETLKFFENNTIDTNTELWAVGSRLERYLKRSGLKPSQVFLLSPTALPQVSISNHLKNQILMKSGRYNKVEILYNNYLSVTQYKPQYQTLLPFNFPQTEAFSEKIDFPPIVETDPLSLFNQVIHQLLSFSLHSILIKSATAEHATRFSLMEEASQNAENLIDEISQNIQALRRQAITREMIELAAGAGLINN